MASDQSRENEEFGDRLKLAREIRKPGVSATEAARQMRMSAPTYLGHENGSRGGKRNYKKYATFYRVNWRWLLEGTGSMASENERETVDLAGLNEQDKQRVKELIALMRRPMKTGTID